MFCFSIGLGCIRRDRDIVDCSAGKQHAGPCAEHLVAQQDVERDLAQTARELCGLARQGDCRHSRTKAWHAHQGNGRRDGDYHQGAHWLFDVVLDFSVIVSPTVAKGFFYIKQNENIILCLLIYLLLLVSALFVV